jgi:hypothetical protein
VFCWTTFSWNDVGIITRRSCQRAMDGSGGIERSRGSGQTGQRWSEFGQGPRRSARALDGYEVNISYTIARPCCLDIIFLHR